METLKSKRRRGKSRNLAQCRSSSQEKSNRERPEPLLAREYSQRTSSASSRASLRSTQSPLRPRGPFQGAGEKCRLSAACSLVLGVFGKVASSFCPLRAFSSFPLSLIASVLLSLRFAVALLRKTLLTMTMTTMKSFIYLFDFFFDFFYDSNLFYFF